MAIKSSIFETKLGKMIAVGDDEGLYLLAFVDNYLEHKIQRLEKKIKAIISPGITDSIKSIKVELIYYFDGTLTQFKTPLHFVGTSFQKRVWHELIPVPYGVTQSYRELAHVIGSEKAFRAVANANGANQLAIIIPCHRIIKSNGDLCGYNGGIERKQWLIKHEKQKLV